MDKKHMMDMALSKIMDDMDDMEGERSNKHTLDECPDPLSCDQHDDGEGAMDDGDGDEGAGDDKGIDPAIVHIKVKKEIPLGAHNQLSPAEIESLRNLIK